MAKGIDDKNPVGRPLTFQTVEELDLAIQKYFDMQDPHIEHYQASAGTKENGETIWETRTRYSDQKPYLMSGLARALGVDRRTLLNYKDREEFFPSIQAALDRCEEYAEGQLFGPYANGAKFSLNNNYSRPGGEWAEKHAVDHTTKGQPMPLLGGTTPLLDDDPEGEAPAAE